MVWQFDRGARQTTLYSAFAVAGSMFALLLSVVQLRYILTGFHTHDISEVYTECSIHFRWTTIR